MLPEILKNLSLRELENLKVLQEKILEMTVRNEKQLLKEDSRQRLEQARNQALDNLLQITAEIKNDCYDFRTTQ